MFTSTDQIKYSWNNSSSTHKFSLFLSLPTTHKLTSLLSPPTQNINNLMESPSSCVIISWWHGAMWMHKNPWETFSLLSFSLCATKLLYCQRSGGRQLQLHQKTGGFKGAYRSAYWGYGGSGIRWARDRTKSLIDVFFKSQSWALVSALINKLIQFPVWRGNYSQALYQLRPRFLSLSLLAH